MRDQVWMNQSVAFGILHLRTILIFTVDLPLVGRSSVTGGGGASAEIWTA
jgi:hypothetical protein